MLRPIPLFVIAAIVGPLALKRIWELTSLVRAGQPNPERFRNLPKRASWELRKVIGQRKLLQWTGPGVAHALTFWGFLVIQVALIESAMEFFWRDARLPVIGTHSWFGAVLDFFVAAVGLSLIAFALVRLKNNPRVWQRRSRFFKSHMGPAYLILVLIFGVVSTLNAVIDKQDIQPGQFFERFIKQAFRIAAL